MISITGTKKENVVVEITPKELFKTLIDHIRSTYQISNVYYSKKEDKFFFEIEHHTSHSYFETIEVDLSEKQKEAFSLIVNLETFMRNLDC
jgi:hypothetical protein